MSTLLSDLAEIGYDAEWHCIPASAIGALHSRDRVWIIAYPHQNGRLHDRAVFRGMPDYVPGEGISAAPMGVFDSQWLLANGNLRDVRADDGISSCVDRLGACGNAVVPQIPEIIGHAILHAEAA
jgi:DNA (cytosine-5)-methyltransferase 1